MKTPEIGHTVEGMMDDKATTSVTGEEIWEALQKDPVFQERILTTAARTLTRDVAAELSRWLAHREDAPMTAEDLVRLKKQSQRVVILLTLKKWLYRELTAAMMRGKSATEFIEEEVCALVGKANLRSLPSTDDSPEETRFAETLLVEMDPSEATVILELNEAARTAYNTGTLTVGTLLRLHPGFFLPWLAPTRKTETEDEAPTP